MAVNLTEHIGRIILMVTFTFSISNQNARRVGTQNHCYSQRNSRAALEATQTITSELQQLEYPRATNLCYRLR